MSIALSEQITESLDLSLFSENLRQLMFQHKIDVAKLHEKTGIAVSTINSLRRGGGNPTLSTLLTLSNFFNISLSALAESPLNAAINSDRNKHELPLIDISEISEYLKNGTKGNQTITDDLQNENPANCFAVQINNSSLAPFFEKGTTFIVAFDKQPQDGDIVLVKFGENLPCFRKIYIEGDSYFFKPISEIVNNKAITTTDFLIYGIVLKAIQVF